MCIFLLDLLIWKVEDREMGRKGKKTEKPGEILSFTGSLLKWPQWHRVWQTEVGSREHHLVLPCGWQGPNYLRNHLARSCIGNKASGFTFSHSNEDTTETGNVLTYCTTTLVPLWMFQIFPLFLSLKVHRDTSYLSLNCFCDGHKLDISNNWILAYY